LHLHTHFNHLSKPKILLKKFKTDILHVLVMHVLRCRESGLDCDFIIKGETKEEFLKNGADHAIQKHGMHANDIYLNNIPVNLLCHSFSEENRED
jgi:predicted small metal-binding protein